MKDNLGNEYVEVEYDDDGNVVSALRYDGNYDIMLDLDVDVILELALRAHKRDMKLNDLLIEIIKNELERISTDE